ncbi:major facilitator superfamily MFS_1 [Parafrankia sp. EAN1pec]|uniref:MFS transporter n=1 Tax=Parafrankia sp. (strain EAN1pec) TaxID=298653 RepID=UPI00015DA00E|nr:major facilitator superfamily MFS_1 [Frankia sp. EAN1pec]
MSTRRMDAEPVADGSGWAAVDMAWTAAQWRRLRRARVATMVVFFFLALLLAAWAPRIPQVKDALALGDGELGLALLGAPVGAIVTLWGAGVLVSRLGSVPVIRFSLVAYATLGLVIIAATGPLSLFAALALLSGASCALDLSANAQAAAVEHRFGRRIMMMVHAAWTAGALVGAGLGAAAAAIELPLSIQFSVLGALTVAGALPLTGWMLRGDGSRESASTGFVVSDAAADAVDGAYGEVETGDSAVGARDGVVEAGAETHARPATSMLPPPPATGLSPESAVPAPPPAPAARPVTAVTPRALLPFVPLSVIAFASFLGEGAAADWSAVYLTDVTGASAGVAGIGYVAFMACMLVVRLVGDRAVETFGIRRVVRPLALTAAVMFAVALASGATRTGTALGIVGFAVLGAGLACVIPAAFSAAARAANLVGLPAGAVIAVVSSVGYAGWLTGPPLIGGLAELVGLRGALWSVVAFTCAIALFAGTLAGPARSSWTSGERGTSAPSRRPVPPRPQGSADMS